MRYSSFNVMYAKFKNKKIERKELEGLIFKKIINDKHRIFTERWEKDDYNDFVSWLYPRLHKAIDLYRETGSSFDSYINMIIKLSSKEYRTRKTNNSVTEYAAWTVQVPEMYVHQEEPEYGLCEDTQETAKTPNDFLFAEQIRNPRQILILILKCYYCVSEDFLEKIAPMTGLTKEKLKELIKKLSSLRAIKEEKKYNMKERMYCQFYRCIVYEKRLSFIPENSPHAIKLKNRLEKARRRLNLMRNRLAKTRSDATNREVGKVIGISKGSVDASLYKIKSRWNKSEQALLEQNKNIEIKGINMSEISLN